MRVQLNTRIHPMGDLIFNPAARPRRPRLARALHRLRRRRLRRVAARRSAEPAAPRHAGRKDPPHRARSVAEHRRPARSARTAATGFRTTTRSSSTPGARKEIWAYGFRNPHRLIWAVDPANPSNNRLIATRIGLHTWETVNIVHKGANYGYSLREGNELLQPDNKTTRGLTATTRFRFR